MNIINHNSTTNLTIKNVTTSRFVIILTKNCDMVLSDDDGRVCFPAGNIVFIERGLNFSCQLRKLDVMSEPFKIISLDK
jgi:hypothetical protein